MRVAVDASDLGGDGVVSFATLVTLAVSCTPGCFVGGLTLHHLTKMGSPPRALPQTVPPDGPRRRARRAAPGRRIRRHGALWLAAAGATLAFGPLLAGAAAVGAVGIARGFPIVHARRLRQQMTRAVPDALDLVVVLLQAGATPRHAVIEVGRQGPPVLRPAFSAVSHRLDRGQPFSESLAGLRADLGDPITPFVELISATDRYGLPTANVVQQLSNETRSIRRRHDEAAARALPVKLSFPLVTCTLPSFVLLAIAPAVLAALSSLGSDAW